VTRPVVVSDDRGVDVGSDRTVGGAPRVEADAPTEEGAGLRWWREALYIVVFYGIYSTIRNRFGSASVDPRVAYEHALEVIDIEKALGLFVEPTIQRWFLDAHWFLWFWNLFYGTFHFIVTAGALIYLYRRFPHDYARWRTALLATTGFALVGFALYPLMPPRLLCTCPYGGGVDFGLVDTLKEVGGLWSFDSGAMQKISNQYAAMPSLHFGWSTWSFLALRGRLRRRWARVAIAAYPWLTLFAIVVTANHYWLDAVGGAVVLGVGLGFAAAVHGVLDRRKVSRPGATGPDALHGDDPSRAIP
jgi:hypothetical protein